MIVGQRAETDRTYGTHRTYMKSRSRASDGRYESGPAASDM
jgi:hypothetical protein